MLELENTFIDSLDDELGKLLKKCHCSATWTKEKHQIRDDIYKLIQREKLTVGEGSRSDYQLYGGAGASLIYKVPLKKRGILSLYKGKVVRIFSYGSSRYKTHFGIQEIDEEVVSKLKLTPKSSPKKA